jgi:hypothetical protein
MVLLLITWALLGLLLGTVGYVLVPWTLAFLGGVELRDRVGQYFIKQTMTVLGDAALVARKQGGVSLTSVSWDASFGADTVTVAGQTGHIADDLGLKSRLAGKPFGIALESHPTYISPLFAEFAERASDALHADRIGPTPDGGMRLDFEIASASVIPNLRGTYRILDGDARRYYSTLAESWAQKSQEKFGKRVSFGQTMLLIAAFGVGVGLSLLVFKYGPVGGGGGGGTTVPIMLSGLLLASVAGDDGDGDGEDGDSDDGPGIRDRARAWLTDNATALRIGGALTLVGVLLLGLVAFAFAGWGLLAAILFFVGLVIGASGPPLAILLFRDGIPLGGLIGTGLAIAAQIAFGEAVLVRRDDGRYEWTVLRDNGRHGYWARLEDGRTIEIDADPGELFAFGFGQLAVAEQKTERNMDRWTVVDTPGDSDVAADTRAGIEVQPPRQQSADSWLVSLATIQRAIRGSASSTLIRRGRDKALDEEGGQQQLSQLWTMGFATALLFGGFGMASVVFML